MITLSETIIEQVEERLSNEHTSLGERSERNVVEANLSISQDYKKLEKRYYMFKRILANIELTKRLGESELRLHSMYNPAVTADKNIQIASALGWVSHHHLAGDAAYDLICKIESDLDRYKITPSNRYTNSSLHGLKLLLADRKVNESMYNSILNLSHPIIALEIQKLEAKQKDKKRKKF